MSGIHRRPHRLYWDLAVLEILSCIVIGGLIGIAVFLVGYAIWMRWG